MYEEEQIFLPEMNIMDRVQYEAPSATRLDIQNDPVKRFQVYTNATAVNFSTNRSLKLDRNDINDINERAQNVKSPQYKNPIGFVLGYYLVKDGDGEINKSHLNYINKNLTSFAPDKMIKIEDVLRYGRLWLTQL